MCSRAISLARNRVPRSFLTTQGGWRDEPERIGDALNAAADKERLAFSSDLNVNGWSPFAQPGMSLRGPRHWERTGREASRNDGRVCIRASVIPKDRYASIGYLHPLTRSAHRPDINGHRNNVSIYRDFYERNIQATSFANFHQANFQRFSFEATSRDSI